MAWHTQFQPQSIHSTAYLATGAVVVGNVTIGSECSVWFNAVIRGDTSPIVLGSRCNIQDGSILHADPGFPCTLADGVTVGHGAIVHGATVEADVLIGMRAVILNGAVLGAGCLIGAGAVVTEGMQVPPGALVLGVPGKVVRMLGPDVLEQNRHTAAHYVQLAQAYRAGAHGPGST